MRSFSISAVSLGLMAALAVAPPESYGQGLADIELSLFGGWSTFSEESFETGPPQATVPVPFRFNVDGHFTAGIRMNILTGTRWGLESYYSYGTTTASYTQRDDDTVRLDLPIQVHGLGATFLYYPTGNGYPYIDNQRRITPFVAGGVGASIFRPTSAARDAASNPLGGNLGEIIESSKASFHYGGGIKYRLTREMVVRFDARGILSGNPTFGLPTESSDPNASVIPLNGMIHDTEVSVSFGLNFGSRP